MVNKTRKRVEVSDSTLEQLQALADFYGHGDPKAALATLAKFGVPMLLGTEVAFSSKPANAPTQIETTPHKCGKQEQPISQVNLENSSDTLAARLGFRYTKDNSSPLVESALAGSPDYCVERELTSSYSVPTDEAIAALASLVDVF